MKRTLIIFLFLLLSMGLFLITLFSKNTVSSYQKQTNIDVFYRFMRKTDINQIDFEKAYALGLSDNKKEINKEYLNQQDAYREILFDYIKRQI